jgi:hypothetical protein
MMTGIPVHAFVDQDHDSHLAVCQDALMRLQADPMLKEMIPAFMAHMAQHAAYAMRAKYAAAMGIPLPVINLHKEADAEDDYPEIDKVADAEISQAAAMAIAQLPKPPPMGGEEAEQMAKELEKQAQELEQKQKQLEQAETALRAEGKQISSAKKEVDRVAMKIKFDEDLAKIKHELRKVEIEKAEIQSKLDMEVKARVVEKISEAAADRVTSKIDKQMAAEDKVEAHHIGERAADAKIAAAKKAEKTAKAAKAKKK